MEKQVKISKGLTENEVKVLNASRITNFGDCMENPQWSFAVCETAGMNEKSYRGVVSSLVKKGLVVIEDNEGKGQFRDMVFGITDQGKRVFNEAESQSMKEFDQAEGQGKGQEEGTNVQEVTNGEEGTRQDTNNGELPNEVPPTTGGELKIEDLIIPGKKGVTNFQMIPAMRKAYEAQSPEQLTLLKQVYPKAFGDSIRYLKKKEREYVEANIK